MRRKNGRGFDRQCERRERKAEATHFTFFLGEEGASGQGQAIKFDSPPCRLALKGEASLVALVAFGRTSRFGCIATTCYSNSSCCQYARSSSFLSLSLSSLAVSLQEAVLSSLFAFEAEALLSCCTDLFFFFSHSLSSPCCSSSCR